MLEFVLRDDGRVETGIRGWKQPPEFVLRALAIVLGARKYGRLLDLLQLPGRKNQKSRQPLAHAFARFEFAIAALLAWPEAVVMAACVYTQRPCVLRAHPYRG